MKSIFCLTKTIFLFNVLCVLFPAETSANVAAFLERQRQLAEEQWNSNDEGLKYEDDEDEDEATGSGAAGTAHRTASTGSSEYQYVYVDEDGEYYEANGNTEDSTVQYTICLCLMRCVQAAAVSSPHFLLPLNSLHRTSHR